MARRPSKKTKLSVMVSSTVYGVEDFLDQLYALLTKFGYDVVMSHRGTVAVNSTEHAFESSLKAVDTCDLFLGIIMPHYGSGVVSPDISITHQEMKRAIELDKPRWFLAHEYVVFARLLMRGLGHKKTEQREKLAFDGAGTLDDLRVIDMYEAAILQDRKFVDRQGNWVQKFSTTDEGLLFATAQFHRHSEIERFLSEHLKDVDAVKASVSGGGRGR